MTLAINNYIATFTNSPHYTFMDLNQEKELVKKAVSDPQCFGELFDSYYPKIFGYVLKRVMDVDSAKDITSETFLKAYKNLWQFKWRNLSVSSWFYKIATNEVNAYFRKKHYSPLYLEELAGDKEYLSTQSAEAETIESEKILERFNDFKKVQANITRLKIKYQEVLTLRFFENMSLKEISEILGKKEGTVKSLISRALSQLREF